MLSRLIQRRRDRAELAELVKLNARRLHDFTIEVAAAQECAPSNFVACLDANQDPPFIRVVRREIARQQFAEFRLKALDTPPQAGVVFVAGRGHAVDAGVLTHV